MHHLSVQQIQITPSDTATATRARIARFFTRKDCIHFIYFNLLICRREILNFLNKIKKTLNLVGGKNAGAEVAL